MVISTRFGFSLFFVCFSRPLNAAYDCHHFDVTCDYRCHDTLFICVMMIQTNKVYPIIDNKSNQYGQLKSLYYSHNSNIKCICLTIKYIVFELIFYVINLYVVSSSIIFSDFILCFYRCITNLNK